MDQVPLVNEMIDAGSRFLMELDKTFPIDVAFWLKGPSDSTRNLHFASSKIGDADRQNAFAEIVRITREMNDPCAPDQRDYLLTNENQGPLSHICDRLIVTARSFRWHPLPARHAQNAPTSSSHSSHSSQNGRVSWNE